MGLSLPTSLVIILKCLDVIVEFWVEVVSVSGVLAAGEDEADLVAFEVDLNEGRLDQIGDVLQMNGGGGVKNGISIRFCDANLPTTARKLAYMPNY